MNAVRETDAVVSGRILMTALLLVTPPLPGGAAAQEGTAAAPAPPPARAGEPDSFSLCIRRALDMATRSGRPAATLVNTADLRLIQVFVGRHTILFDCRRPGTAAAGDRPQDRRP
ncbi:MAG: hypothetical protein RLY86_2218 [Pseudomonadota bacterium]|jgi:hypothetical protein